METSKDEQLSGALATLNDLIALTRGAGLNETAQFLAMAKLNLLIDLNGITEEEFRALCIALEAGDQDGGRRTKAVRQRHAAAPGNLPPRDWRALDRLAALQAGARTKQ